MYEIETTKVDENCLSPYRFDIETTYRRSRVSEHPKMANLWPSKEYFKGPPVKSQKSKEENLLVLNLRLRWIFIKRTNVLRTFLGFWQLLKCSKNISSIFFQFSFYCSFYQWNKSYFLPGHGRQCRSGTRQLWTNPSSSHCFTRRLATLKT